MRKAFANLGSVALACCALAHPAQAQPAAASGDLLDFTCGQYMQAVSIANPGERANAQRKAQAVSAQDALVNVVLWVHGYKSGKAGGAPGPLTQAWMVETVGSIAKACEANSKDGTMRVADVVTKM